MADDPIARAPRRRGSGPCPICGRPGEAVHRPFCSRRCREVDLARWFSGAYRLPAGETDPDDQPSADRDQG